MNATLEYKGEYDEQGRKHGIWEKYPGVSKVLNSKRTYVNGIRHGYYEKYYLNGLLAQTGYYVEGKKEGISYFYYENGKKVQLKLIF